MLKKGVVYVIEDSRSPEMIKASLPEYECEIVRFLAHRKQDNLTIVRNR
jgi:hypothetical protein